jgi:glutamate-1-semialdehyde aminotransferase
MKSKTNDMWTRAKRVIPGGTSLFSKRPELHLPNLWPSHFSSAKGCIIHDLDGQQYIDVSLMGVGTNVLGYAHDPIDQAVISNIKLGNMSSLNCSEEVILAEKLADIDDCIEMVRFTRSGGEANAIALRIARAATQRDVVLICGYHGWHDWYLSTNLKQDKLKAHHLAGLEASGVPSSLAGTTLSFNYNDIEGLKYLLQSNRVAAIIMEVTRNIEPHDDFLLKVRNLATDNGCVLIFDECSSGFRQTFGGLYTDYNVTPDMVVYGKTIANGYALNVVGGRRDVMDAAQKTFISSTFWTERTGPTAALATLSEMERLNSFDHVLNVGRRVKKNWTKIASDAGIKVEITGIDAIPNLTFEKDHLLYKSFLTKTMLAKGYLASTMFYCSIAHTDLVLEQYFEHLSETFDLMKQYGRDKIMSELDGSVCHSSFQRLN